MVNTSSKLQLFHVCAAQLNPRSFTPSLRFNNQRRTFNPQLRTSRLSRALRLTTTFVDFDFIPATTASSNPINGFRAFHRFFPTLNFLSFLLTCSFLLNRSLAHAALKSLHSQMQSLSQFTYSGPHSLPICFFPNSNLSNSNDPTARDSEHILKMMGGGVWVNHCPLVC